MDENRDEKQNFQILTILGDVASQVHGYEVIAFSLALHLSG